MKFYSLWLSLVCIFVFIVQTLFFGFTDMFVLNQSSFIEPYRFITAIFLHGSLVHLIYNLFALILFGLILEKLIGNGKFLLVFFSSGIIANLISVNFYSSSLGASGAIFGVIGALTVIRPMMNVWAFSLPMPLFVAAILWVVGDVIQTFVPSNIGTIAHLSGIFVGIIFGFFYREKLQVKKNRVIIDEGYMRAWEDRFIR